MRSLIHIIAPPEKQNFILENYPQIQIGDTQNQVKNILGTPDKVLSLYEPQVYRPKKIGFSFIYLLQQLKEHGSQNEKAVKLVQISFDLNGKVNKVAQ